MTNKFIPRVAFCQVDNGIDVRNRLPIKCVTAARTKNE